MSFAGQLYVLVVRRQLFSFIHMVSVGVSHVLDEVMSCRDLGLIPVGTRNFGGLAVGGRALIMLSVECCISYLMLWWYLVLFHMFASVDL